MEQDIETLRQQLKQQEKLASLGMLSAGIAHEIQNPLNFVINFSKMSTMVNAPSASSTISCLSRVARRTNSFPQMSVSWQKNMSG